MAPVKERLEVGYWSDPLCIWAYLAHDRVERVVAAHGDRLDVRHHVVPVFGSLAQRFASGSWAEAGPKGRAHTTREIARRFGHDEVSAEGFVRDPPATSWAPSLAAEAVALMEADGIAPTQATGRYLQALRRAFLVDDRNTARRTVQLEVAEALELDRAALVERLDDGRALARLWEDHDRRLSLGIQGSPTWVFDGGRSMLYGNYSEAVLQATVDELLAGLGAGSSAC